MKILLVNDHAKMLGGTEAYVFSLAYLLEKHGHQVELFGKKKTPHKTVVLTRIYNPAWSWRISRVIEEFKPDIIHAHHVSYVLSPSVLRAAQRHGVPVVMTVHDFHLVCPKTWFIHAQGHPCTYGFGRECFKTGCALRPYDIYVSAKLALHRKMIAGNVDCMIAGSQVLADWLQRNLGYDYVHVLPNFIAISGVSPSPFKESKDILFVGRLVPEKGAEYLIKAMPYIASEVPDARLVIVGDGEQGEYLQGLCRDLGISSRVVFTGWKGVDEMGAYYDAAQLVCVPSVWMENCPLVLLDAIAYQRPVIASEIGGIPELVREGEMGLLFEPGNHLDLAEKAVRLLTDFQLSKRFSDNTTTVRYIYSEEYHYQQLAGIYTSCLEGS